MTLQKIDELKEPPIVGEYYLVPCILVKKPDYLSTTGFEKFIDSQGEYTVPVNIMTEGVTFYTPVYNHPHSDRENGQNYTHYHTDYRFEIAENCSMEFKGGLRHILYTDGYIKYIKLMCKSTIEPYATSRKMINKSRLCHHKIHKGKCPHRGYDLSQVEPNEDGEIVCPLHSLRFNAITKQLIH